MKISIIIPCFNNEGSLYELMERIMVVRSHAIFAEHSFEYVLVDDGSSDQTYERQLELKNANPAEVKVVRLTRNFGSYNSLLAGIHHSSGDCLVYLHADLQDPPELIPQLFTHFLKGNKLVIANRQDREDKSLLSNIYHWMVKRFAIRDIPSGGFDLIMFDSQIKEDLLKISAKNTNIVYLISWLGYPYANVPYKRSIRTHGTSQWRFWKKVGMFVDTFFSFSDIPLNFIRASFIISLIIFIVIISLVLTHVISNNSLIYVALSLILMICTLNFLIIAEFLARIYETVSNRPDFVVKDVI